MFQLFLFYVAQKSRNKVKPKEKRRKQSLFCFLFPWKVRTNKSTLVTIKKTQLGVPKTTPVNTKKKRKLAFQKAHWWTAKKNTTNNWIAALQISHTVFPQVEEKHVVDLKTTGARGWGPAAPISKKKTE